MSEVQLLAVSHWGIHLVKREGSTLHVLKSFALAELGPCTAPRPTSVCIENTQGKISLHTNRAQQLSDMVTRFCSENKKVSEFDFSLKTDLYYKEIIVPCFTKIFNL